MWCLLYEPCLSLMFAPAWHWVGEWWVSSGGDQSSTALTILLAAGKRNIKSAVCLVSVRFSCSCDVWRFAKCAVNYTPFHCVCFGVKAGHSLFATLGFATHLRESCSNISTVFARLHRLSGFKLASQNSFPKLTSPFVGTLVECSRSLSYA